MKKNFSNAKTMPDAYREVDKYVKAADLKGGYKKDELQVQGIFSHKGKYGLSYALAVVDKDERFFLNIPQWLGSAIMKDMGDTPYMDYFIGTSIAEIVDMKTGNGDSISIEFYTPED